MNTVVRSLSTAVKKLDLNGIFVPLITPFTSGGKIDFDKVERNVFKFENEANLTGYVVGGSNSEVATLSPDERIDLVSRIRKLVKPQKVILGGATSESTELAYKMSKDMGKAGADGVLIMTPFYFKKLMTEDVIADHFTRIADESPIPIVLYNMPLISGIDISIGLLKRLAKHPNIRGVKDSDIRKMAITVEETKGLNFNVLAGSAGYLLPALQVGCTGGIVALAGPLGPEVCKLHQLVTERKWEEAIALQNKLIPIDLMLPATFGVPGVKAAMKLKGFDSGHCRLPLVDAKQEDTALIKNTLEKLGFL